MPRAVLCVALLAAPQALIWTAADASVLIQSFSLRPASPDTGEPLVLSAVIQSTSSCRFIDASIRFGPQPELGGGKGWGIDVDFQDGLMPVVSTCPIEKNLGPLQVAAADGVLRARNNGMVDDVRLFTLSVSPGAAPGWDDPTFHEEFPLDVLSSGITFIPGLLAVSDFLTRRILLVDPDSGQPLSSLPSPGTGDVRGLAFDGTDFYASVQDVLGPRIYKVNLQGNILDFFSSPVVSPGSAPLEGLAFLGGVLYGSYQTPPRLFAIDPATHLKLWDRSLPAGILGLDSSPEGLLGVTATGEFYFIEPSPSGQDVLLADSRDTGVTWHPQFAGLAYDGFRIFAWDSLSLEMVSMRTFALWWALDGTLQAYVPPSDVAVDVIRGDLENMFQLAGYLDLSYFGPAACLLSKSAGGIVLEPDDPPTGHVFFYLARFVDTTGSASYYGRDSFGLRRIDSSQACP